MIIKTLERAANHIEREASLLEEGSSHQGDFDLDDPNELYTAQIYASEMELASDLRLCVLEVRKLIQDRDRLALRARFLIRRCAQKAARVPA